MSAHLPILCISDIHGCYYTMLRLLNAAPKPFKLVFLGDLIDRGPHSRLVVEFAMTHAIPTVCANHEDLALAYSAHARRGYKAHCTNYYERDIWIYNGGDKALKSWDLTEQNRREGLPKDVLDWMASLPAYLYPSEELDANGRRLLASHSGYGLAADESNWFQALWGRHVHGDGEFPDDGLYRVFGHTPALTPEVTDTYTMIDTGAAYASRGFGHLTGFVWPTKETITVPYDESPVQPAFTVAKGGCISS